MKSLESQPWPVELGRKENRRRLQDRVRALEFGVLPFQPLDLSRLLTAEPGPRPLIDLVLADPLAQRLRRTDTQQVRHMRHRGPVRDLIRSALVIHPHRPSLQLSRIPLRRVPRHDSNLPKVSSLRTPRGDSTPTSGSWMNL